MLNYYLLNSKNQELFREEYWGNIQIIMPFWRFLKKRNVIMADLSLIS